MQRKENFSQKRNAILQTIQSTKTHPTAEWIYHNLKQEYPNLSLGTVYRNLNRFRKDGIITTIAVFNEQKRFDGNTKPHAHFICERCGAIMDLDAPVIHPEFKQQICNAYHINITTQEILFKGNCLSCKTKELC